MTTNYGIVNGVPSRGIGGTVASRTSPISLNERYFDGRELPLYDFQESRWFVQENSPSTTWAGVAAFSTTTPNSGSTFVEVPFDVGFEGKLTDISVWVQTLNGTATPSIVYAVYDYVSPTVRRLVQSAGSAPFNSTGTKTVSGLSIPVKRRFIVYACLTGLDTAQANPTFGFHTATPLFRSASVNPINGGNNAPSFRPGSSLSFNGTWPNTINTINGPQGLGLAVRVIP